MHVFIIPEMALLSLLLLEEESSIRVPTVP